MAGELQPLDQKFPIVDDQGRPTRYFTQWAQQKQIDISDGITLDQAQQLIDDFAAARQIIAGRALDGGGVLSGDVTIDHAESLVTPGTYGSATKVPQFVVDQEGHVQGVTEVPISGGGGGGDYSLIANQVIAAGAASVAFAAIPATFRDLIIEYSGNTSGANISLLMRFNGISTTTYDTVFESRFEYTTAFNATAALLGVQSGVGFNVEGDAAEATIYRYADAVTKNIMARSLGFGGGNYFTRHINSRWRSIAAITDILIFPSAGTFNAGIVSLYGRGKP
jgi:hypothetical protein